MRVHRPIRELKEVHDLELELLSVLIIIGVRSGKEKRKTKRDSHCRQQTTAGWWSTRFNFGSASRIEKKHTRGRQNKCVLKRYALGGQRNENEIQNKTENWSDWTKVKAINQWPRTRVRLDVFLEWGRGWTSGFVCVNSSVWDVGTFLQLGEIAVKGRELSALFNYSWSRVAIQKWNENFRWTTKMS